MTPPRDRGGRRQDGLDCHRLIEFAPQDCRQSAAFLLRNPVDRLDPQALFCTDPAREPLQILTWYVRRWQVEVTFREVRATTSGSRPSASGRTALHAVSARAVLAGRPARRSSPPQARQASRPPP